MPYTSFFYTFNNLVQRLILIFFICCHVPLKAKSNTSAPVTQIAQAFINSTQNLNIESTSLGIDRGIIANTLIGIGRTIERNPNSQGKNDYYLVKDRMRLGFELGVGLVLAGTITYAQEWTLVYPVSKKMEGVLSRKFIVDLFLFHNSSPINNMPLPKNFALVRESFIEGKGRLKIGGASGLLLGNQGSKSKINLETVLIKASEEDNNELKIMRQKSHHQKLAYELWLNLVVFDLPIFDASNESGTLERQYFKTDYLQLEEVKRDKLMKSLFSGRGSSLLDELNVSKRLTSDFEENNLEFSLFFAFERQRQTRIDDITQTTLVTDEYGETQESTSRSWQWEDRSNHEWSTGFKSEQYKSKIFLIGIPQENEDGITTYINNPQLKIKLEVIDDETTQKELDDTYWPLLNNFADQRSNKQRANTLSFKHMPESKISLEIQFNENALTRILETDEEQWYDALSLITIKKVEYWRSSANNGLHSRQRRQLRQTRLPFSDIQLLTKVRNLITATRKARKELSNGNNLLALRHLLKGLRSTFTLGQNTLDTKLLQIVKSIAGSQNTYASTSLEIFSENIVNQFKQETGKNLWVANNEHQFLFEDPSEIYYFFEERSDN